MTKPNVFIVGAAKCGTSAMYHYLTAHPQIYMSPRKEPHFFGSDLGFRPPRYIRDRATYLALFDKVQDEKYAGEASTWYLFSKYAAREIWDFNRSAKIIIMLRSPTDMVHALYYQNIFVGNENIRSFRTALEAEKDRKKGKRIPKTASACQPLLYTEAAHFSEQVRRYFQVFGRDQVHVIIYDDLQADTAQVYRETLEFLGVDIEFQPAFENVNQNKVVRNLALRNLLRKPPDKLLSLGKLLLPLSRPIYRTLKHVNVETKPRPPIPADLKAELQKLFWPEVVSLSHLLNRDLTHWGLAQDSISDRTTA